MTKADLQQWADHIAKPFRLARMRLGQTTLADCQAFQREYEREKARVMRQWEEILPIRRAGSGRLKLIDGRVHEWNGAGYYPVLDGIIYLAKQQLA